MTQEFDVEVSLVQFPLHPDTPREGRLLSELFPGRDLEAAHLRMARLMELEGLPYGRRTYTYNSRLAQELGKWADTRPGSDGVHQALFRAYFVEARNVSDVNVLVDVAQSVGLPANEARDVLTERRFAEAVDANWVRSRAAGVTGVPTFVYGNSRVVGAQPYESLQAFMRQAGVASRVT